MKKESVRSVADQIPIARTPKRPETKEKNRDSQCSRKEIDSGEATIDANKKNNYGAAQGPVAPSAALIMSD